MTGIFVVFKPARIPAIELPINRLKTYPYHQFFFRRKQMNCPCFRVQKLSNVSTVLGVMQRERARTEGLDPGQIVLGEPGPTLALVWNIILR